MWFRIWVAALQKVCQPLILDTHREVLANSEIFTMKNFKIEVRLFHLQLLRSLAIRSSCFALRISTLLRGCRESRDFPNEKIFKIRTNYPGGLNFANASLRLFTANVCVLHQWTLAELTRNGVRKMRLNKDPNLEVAPIRDFKIQIHPFHSKFHRPQTILSSYLALRILTHTGSCWQARHVLDKTLKSRFDCFT